MKTGTGRVVFYDAEARYGFIEPDDGSADVVFSVLPGQEPPAVGDPVGFELMPELQVTSIGKQALRIWKLTPSLPRAA